MSFDWLRAIANTLRHLVSNNSEDTSAEIVSLRRRAENGEADAQLGLGILYATGRGLPMNLEEAVNWYRKAAEQGKPEAQTALGAYAFAAKNYAVGIKWYRMAAEQGDSTAQVHLSMAYDLGLGAWDEAQSIQWLNKSIDQRNPLAFASMAGRSEVGRGVPLNLVEALKWYVLSLAEQDDVDFRSRMVNLQAQMTPDQIAEAQRLAREWRPKGE